MGVVGLGPIEVSRATGIWPEGSSRAYAPATGHPTPAAPDQARRGGLSMRT